MTSPKTFVNLEELRLSHARQAWIAEHKPTIAHSRLRRPQFVWCVKLPFAGQAYFAPTFQGAVDSAMEAIK